MKRRGKSPPPDGQPAGHEKPRVVQDKTGGVWRLASSALGRGRSRVLVAPCLGRAFRFGGMREMTVTRGVSGPRVTEFGLPPPAACFFAKLERLKANPWGENSKSFNTSHEMPSRFSRSITSYPQRNLRPAAPGGRESLYPSAQSRRRVRPSGFFAPNGQGVVSCPLLHPIRLHSCSGVACQSAPITSADCAQTVHSTPTLTFRNSAPQSQTGQESPNRRTECLPATSAHAAAVLSPGCDSRAPDAARQRL